jgi:hypothetical protein
MPAFSVLIPTLNCMALLPAHLRSMRPWLDLAHEIIVVDSHSTDGTVDYLRTELAGLPLRIEMHPRGLYQSWNYGISLARSEWLYISTVGDSISRDLLLHLHQLGKTARCDVVISRPAFIDEEDQPLPTRNWAVTELSTTLAKDEPRVITGAAALFYAVRHLHTSALLGSTASNLYRTAHLQARPFPTDFGTAGDAAWSMRYSFETRYGFTPMTGSTFRIHAKAYEESEYRIEALSQKLVEVALAANNRHADREDVKTLRISAIHALAGHSAELYAGLKQMRQCCRPWFFFPKVWGARRCSRQAKQELQRATAHCLSAIRDRYSECIELKTPDVANSPPTAIVSH